LLRTATFGSLVQPFAFMSLAEIADGAPTASLDDFDHDDGNVVLAAAIIGQLDEAYTAGQRLVRAQLAIARRKCRVQGRR
jgi:hypothetical protein